MELDPSIKESLNALIRELDTGEKQVRWVKAQGLHLTLKFLGEISQTRAEEIKTLLQQVSKNHQAFPLTVKGTGRFPPGSRRPRAVSYTHLTLPTN